MFRAIVSALVVLAAGLSLTVFAGDDAATKVEKTTLNQCPDKVQGALTMAAEAGLLKGISKETKGEAVTYVAEISVTVDSEGKIVKETAGTATNDKAAGAAGVKAVTIEVTDVRLADVCAMLSNVAGVPITCGGAFNDKPVTLSVKDAPLVDVVQAIARQTATRADPRDGGYRFRTGK